MLYGILAILVLPVVCTGLVLAGRGDVLRSVICVVAPTVLVFSKLVKRRHHCAIRSEGTLLGITNLCITPCHGFVNPGELPWYVG